MRIRSRLDRLTNRRRATRPGAPPLVIFLIEATVGQPVGTRVVWDGRAREVTFDPAAGPPPLPPGGPHKLIAGPAFDV
ncbi:hypothetical protein [Limnoglobus roseus]|uniref:Uncharacterized protein n=1 Tax=Limnoglobus roseus TaxID=2598579 RepID=A0A5C1ANB6_9BACT|nr:hypothetical protein [Limnoglobus roseus]QEL20480.1 hypothetical protein PX52LOC_07581 [Limnoglobus roseus]